MELLVNLPSVGKACIIYSELQVCVSVCVHNRMCTVMCAQLCVCVSLVRIYMPSLQKAEINIITLDCSNWNRPVIDNGLVGRETQLSGTISSLLLPLPYTLSYSKHAFPQDGFHGYKQCNNFKPATPITVHAS